MCFGTFKTERSAFRPQVESLINIYFNLIDGDGRGARARPRDRDGQLGGLRMHVWIKDFAIVLVAAADLSVVVVLVAIVSRGLDRRLPPNFSIR